MANIVQNGDFSTNDLSGWYFHPDGANSASAASGAAVITLGQAGVATQLMQTGIALTAGQEYTFSFTASGSVGTFLARIIQDAIPNTPLMPDQTITTSDTPQNYSFNFTAGATENNARIQFYFAASSPGTVTIDNVVLDTATATGDTFDASSGKACMNLTGNATNVGLSQSGLTIVNGKNYGVNFEVQGPAGQTLTVKVVDTSSNNNLGYNEDILLNGNVQQISSSFLSIAASADATLYFDGVGIVGEVCIDNVCLGQISASITATFDYSPQTIFENDVVNFTDSSTATNGITTWAWDFGDGTTSNAQNPTHSFTTAGSYSVELVVTGPDGSSGTTYFINVLSNTVEVGAVDISGEFVMDGGGNVTMISAHWATGQKLLNMNSQNLLGQTTVSFNVFTGLLQITCMHSSEVLHGNIDTGGYEVVDATTNAVLRTGTEQKIKNIGDRFPIDPLSGLLIRGETYWNWWKNNVSTLESWPTLYEAQFVKANSI